MGNGERSSKRIFFASWGFNSVGEAACLKRDGNMHTACTFLFCQLIGYSSHPGSSVEWFTVKNWELGNYVSHFTACYCMCATQILNFGLCDILEQVSGVLFHVFVVAVRVCLLQFFSSNYHRLHSQCSIHARNKLRLWTYFSSVLCIYFQWHVRREAMMCLGKLYKKVTTG